MTEILAQNQLIMIPITIMVFIFSLSIHEFFHAFTADRLGDPTAKNFGRLTLNPKAHLDPLGTILPIILLLFGSPFVFGWGKPVPFNPRNLRNPRRDGALISLAGPLSNFGVAIIFSLLIRLIPLTSVFTSYLYITFYILIIYNLVLGFFNLIPLGPLDGNKVVFGFLPDKLAIQWMEIQRYGLMLLLILVFTNTSSKMISSLISISTKILGL